MEWDIHEYLKDYRIRGEWFRDDDFVMETIERIMYDGWWKCPRVHENREGYKFLYGDCDDGYKCHGYEDGEPIPLLFREEGY